MGLNVYVNLVVGVPLTELGTLREDKQIVNLVDSLGSKTGRSIDLVRVYFDALNGGNWLIGSNEDSIVAGAYHPDIEYFYNQLLDVDDIDDSDWFHQSDHNIGIDQVIIGLSPKLTKGPVDGRYESFSMSPAYSVDQLLLKVKPFLEDKFGYTGKVYVVSLIYYSY